jgi:hypothetical protein
MRDGLDNPSSRLNRPTVLALVLALHAAVILLASRWLPTRVEYRKDDSLVFMALPDRVRAGAPVSAPSSPPPRKKPVAPHDTQLVTIPTPALPAAADKPDAPIDWSAEADLAVKQHAQLALATPPRALDKHGAGADLNGGLGPDPKQKADFGWDYSHTHRVENIEGGGILIHISDRCVLVLFPLPFGGCSIGKIPARGDLLDHMHEAPALDGRSKNTAP